MKQLSVKLGTYTDKNGQEKARYKQVGVIAENQNGQYARLDLVALSGVCALYLAKGESELLAGIYEPKNNAPPSQQNAPDNYDDNF